MTEECPEEPKTKNNGQRPTCPDSSYNNCPPEGSLYERSSANFIARSIALIFSGERVERFRSSLFFETVRMLSGLTTQSLGKPSSGPNFTSTGISWTVRVMGATVTEARTE